MSAEGSAAAAARPGGPPAQAAVVVVGAGLAGLAAAVLLRRAGVDAALLEARERVGGRLLTLRAPFTDGLFAEAGPEFISPAHADLHAWLAACGVATRPREFGPRLLCLGGRTRRAQSIAAFGGRLPAQVRRLAEATAAVSDRVPAPLTAWEAPDAAALDGQSLGAWVDAQSVDPLMRAYLHTWMTLDYGVHPRGLSLLTYARDEQLLHGFGDQPGTQAPGGLDQLTDGMAAHLSASLLHLATRVTSFAHAAGGVELAYERGGGTGSIAAGHAILAVPASVLRTWAVEPPWEPARQQAIAGVRYGHVMKVHLQFRRRFWLDHGRSRGVFTDGPLQSAWDSTGSQRGDRGILTVYKAGHEALALTGLPETERLARCLAQLEAVYPGCSAEFEQGAAVDWDAEPATRGAYSHFAPGELTAYAPWLARPAGRVHFAGEHTDPWQATMNGALASGARAAREVMQALGLPAAAGALPRPAREAQHAR